MERAVVARRMTAMAAATVVVERVAVTARVVVWPAAERAEARVALARVLPALLIVQVGALDDDVPFFEADFFFTRFFVFFCWWSWVAGAIRVRGRRR